MNDFFYEIHHSKRAQF